MLNSACNRKSCNASTELRKLVRNNIRIKNTPNQNFDICSKYYISIKPKFNRSSSLSDLTTSKSDLGWEVLSQSNHLLKNKTTKLNFDISGDSEPDYIASSKQIYQEYRKLTRQKHKKRKRMAQESVGSKFASDFVKDTLPYDGNNSSALDNSSDYTVEDVGQIQKTFPFKETPSGNLKVQSNQVVFQSSIVGVLLADPTQAKVKVKIEGQSAGDPEFDAIHTNDEDSEAQYRCNENENVTQNLQVRCQCSRSRTPGIREDKGKDLHSLGYALPEPVDWMRVSLPKKGDLCHEFLRRVHNFINTDTVVQIEEDAFHCHRMVLQIYSGFFESDTRSEIELPSSNVTPESFQSIYEWMILGSPDSNRILKRENILDIFLAAQYLKIKDLEEQCWSFIVNDSLFYEDSAFALYRQARIRGISPVMDIMIPRIMRFFLPLVASKDFLELQPIEVVTFLRSNYICVTSEIEVLMAAVRWLYGDWPARREYAVELMKCVRFGLISPWQLVDIKRNPDNGEILEIVNGPEVQQMVDDGLAFVIIKYWYGNNSKDYYHWIDVLGLTEPAERNWIGEEMNHVTYKDFLKYLEQFMVSKDQMFQQMSMLQPMRRGDEMHCTGSPRSFRGGDKDGVDSRRQKFDLPLPLLRGMAPDKIPNMSDIFESRKKDGSRLSMSRSPPMEGDVCNTSHFVRRPTKAEFEDIGLRPGNAEQHPVHNKITMRQVHMCLLEQNPKSGLNKRTEMYDPPEKDSEDFNTTNSESSSGTVDTSCTERRKYGNGGCSTVDKTRKRTDSVAACYLASATGEHTGRQLSTSKPDGHKSDAVVGGANNTSPAISMFNESKEIVAKMIMNKISTSILGPSNRNYLTDESLFNWDRETVLVFGGIDPHNPYGVGRNTGKDVYRYDPVLNTWDNVGELPEPRHHHSVAFLRGRIYLVGGADPRDDDQRGKSVVVSTVWSYEPVTRSWYSENGLQTPRKNFGLVVHRMALYAIGGQDKKGRVLRSVEKFDPKVGSWVEVKSMGVARMAVAATKCREYIWVAGGMTSEKKKPLSMVVECYNSKTNEWSEIKPLRFPRCFSTLFAMSDKLYLIGGAGRFSDKDNTASSVGAIDVWDWKDREWKELTEMSIPRHGHALAYLGTQLIIIGGVTTIYMHALNNVESFCCERGAWIRGVASLPSPLSGHGAVTLPPASFM